MLPSDEIPLWTTISYYVWNVFQWHSSFTLIYLNRTSWFQCIPLLHLSYLSTVHHHRLFGFIFFLISIGRLPRRWKVIIRVEISDWKDVSTRRLWIEEISWEKLGLAHNRRREFTLEREGAIIWDWSWVIEGCRSGRRFIEIIRSFTIHCCHNWLNTLRLSFKFIM
jgi:hypothetical protein